MHIAWQILYIERIPQTKVVVARDEKFVTMRQLYPPVEKVKRFCFRSSVSKIAGMYHNICIG